MTFGSGNHFTGHHEPPHLSGHGGAVRRGRRQEGCRHHGQQRCAWPPAVSPAVLKEFTWAGDVP
eukprot:scaffold178279_cov19-Prasinocladus_malaysianus.AAC.1